MSGLADRVRGIVGSSSPAPLGPTDAPVPPGQPRQSHPHPPTRADPTDPRDIVNVLGGTWCHSDHRADDDHGACFVVERRVDPSSSYGHARVGDFAACLAAAAAEASIVAGGAARPPFTCVDLETTGLSGGAGTHAFLIGCGRFDEGGGFVTRQYVMTRYADERPMLATVAAELTHTGALVSFNGKSFDAPVLETRYLFHRLEWAAGGLPHLDVLHPARRFWGTATTSCSLVALEQQVLGAWRQGDVPGFEIPARYFQFVRSGDARPLVAVLEHNRLDLLSLAGLAARLLYLVGAGAKAARDAREALALGAVYGRAGLDARARDAYERAAAPGGASIAEISVAALRALAILSRRARRYHEAAACWHRLLAVDGCPPHAAREATQALAIHHEHRLRDFAAAKTFALKGLERGQQPAWTDAVRHRLARIDRKMAGAEQRAGRLL